MEHLLSLIHPAVKDFLNLPIFPSGKQGLSLGMILHVLVLLAILVFLTKRLKNWLIERVLVQTHFDTGFRYTVGAIFSYLFLLLGLSIVLDTAGVDTTAVTVVAGALGLGVSLSLQTIISNCFAGLFILLERKIKVGDRIQIGDLVGRVMDISLRASSLVTSENTLVIVPNSDFISSRVINLSYDNKIVYVTMQIATDWTGDPQSLIELLSKIAAQEPGVVNDRPVDVLIKSFAKDQQTLKISVWTEKYADKKEVLQSNLNSSIIKALREKLDKKPKGIEE